MGPPIGLREREKGEALRCGGCWAERQDGPAQGRKRKEGVGRNTKKRREKRDGPRKKRKERGRKTVFHFIFLNTLN